MHFVAESGAGGVDTHQLLGISFYRHILITGFLTPDERIGCEVGVVR